MLLHALGSHTQSQRQWKGELPVYKLQATCLSVHKSDWYSPWLFEWLLHTRRVHDIQTHLYISAHRHGEQGVSSRHRCNQTNIHFYERYRVCVAQSWRSFFMASKVIKCSALMIDVSLWFLENMPTHVMHIFWGWRWFPMSAAVLNSSEACWLKILFGLCFGDFYAKCFYLSHALWILNQLWVWVLT